mgnify:CR=1 FL=1
MAKRKAFEKTFTVPIRLAPGVSLKDSDTENLTAERLILISYMQCKRKTEDWHGVMDAAADLREVDARLSILRNQ